MNDKQQVLRRSVNGLALMMLLSVTGCYKASFHRDPSVVRGREHDEWSGLRY
jgi:hypothetical protein